MGFKINEVEHYALKYKDKNIIGAFGVTFHNRSQFIYKATTYCTGLFIRKERWQQLLLEQDHHVCDLLKQNIMISYMFHFRTKMVSRKKKVIEQFKSRNDYTNMGMVDNADTKTANKLIEKMFGTKNCDSHCVNDDTCLQIEDSIK